LSSRLLFVLLIAPLIDRASPAATLRYWVEPCTYAENVCHADDPELAQWAMEAWQAASEGHLTLERVSSREKAHIRLFWTGGRPGLYGEARPIMVEGVRGAEVYVVTPDAGRDPLLRDAIVYLTCVHETGHALGLAHTDAFADIMYSFQYGGDIAEYFGRYRRKLAGRTDMHKTSALSDDDRKSLMARYR